MPHNCKNLKQLQELWFRLACRARVNADSEGCSVKNNTIYDQQARSYSFACHADENAITSARANVIASLSYYQQETYRWRLQEMLSVYDNCLRDIEEMVKRQIEDDLEAVIE